MTGPPETNNSIPIALLDLTAAYHVNDRTSTTSIWKCAVDDHWYVVANAQLDPIHVAPKGGAEVAVPPWHFAIWFNGFPAGLLSANGGEFATGELANSTTFIQAIRQHIAKRQTTSP